MDQRQCSVLSLACAAIVLACAGRAARADNFQEHAVAFFTHVQEGTQQGGLVPYVAVGDSDLIGCTSKRAPSAI